ncbi:hypothetical protein MATR_27860 [Marivirga tractuosa]|nr:hypothetical protein MATR_27860 [Marivirga tractuosa]
MSYGRSPDSSVEVAAFPSAGRLTVARIVHFNLKMDLQLRGQFRTIDLKIQSSTEFPFNSEGLLSNRNHNSVANVGE